jgi:hypothetical protein
MIRKWLHKYVGFDANGKMNNCLVIYDYVKLMSAEKITNNMAEFQALGFLMTSMHNFTVKHDIPLLATIQLNRDGIDKETTDVVAGSDRVLWLTTNFSIFKDKSPEEIAQDGINEGNKKIVVLKSRHGSGLQQGDYINMTMKGEFATIIEGKTRYQLRKEKDTQKQHNIEDV